MIMKKLIFVAIAVVLTAGMLAISGCGKKKQPEVQTVGVSDITSSSAKLNAVIINDGNDRIVSSGFYYSTDQGMSNKQTVQNNGYGSSESFSVYLSNLQASITYYYQAFAINGKGTGIGEVMSFTTSAATSGGSSGGSQGGGTPTPSPTPTPGQLNGHAYVDLGLPSGTLWATCNVGAETPEGYGNYYAWGEILTKSEYSLSSYTYSNNPTTLPTDADVAYIDWGVGWRMPTVYETRELNENCTWTWTEQNGVEGYIIEGINGNSIFLPAVSYRHDDNLGGAGEYGYWSSSLYTNDFSYAWAIRFYWDFHGVYYSGRSDGFTVRPVCSSNTPSVQSYTVTFNANGGTGYMQPQTFRQGVSQALSANSFYRDGYTFSGWNTAANGNGVSYYDRQTITVNSNMTLYAQWTANGGSQGSGQLNGHAYVDLGLPSGTKWATCNVGATTPEGYGNYYAWGETFPKSEYNSNNYTYSDDPIILPANADAATANWGSGWGMPTQDEITELISNCTHIFTTQNGVNGQLFTGTNGNSIFLPAAGIFNNLDLHDVGTSGFYWSSSNETNEQYDARSIMFFDSLCGGLNINRSNGLPVRPVCHL